MGINTNYTQELTPREKEIEHAICEKGIFKDLDLSLYFHLSICTIKSHVQSILAKRRVASKCELIFKHYQKSNAQNAF